MIRPGAPTAGGYSHAEGRWRAMLLWHLGGTVWLARYTFRDDRMDLRLLLLGAVLPDLIDTPVGLAAYGSLGSVRLVAHSLLFATVVMVVVLGLTRRGRPRKRWMPLAIGVLFHLLLDAMWADPETLWWPFLGLSFAPAGAVTAGSYVADVVGDVRMWVLEVVGIVYLVVLGLRARLGDYDARRNFLKSGRVHVPIERD